LTDHDATLKETLDAFLAQVDFTTLVKSDPIVLPRRWPAGPDRELAALIAASLSYGRADLIARALREMVQRMGPTPAKSAMAETPTQARARFHGFVYRVTRGVDLARLWSGAGTLLRQYGTLGRAFGALDRTEETDLRMAIAGFRRAIHAATEADFVPRRGFLHLLANPAGQSALKRWCMFLRWMVRGPDAIDFGDWAPLGTHRLTMPLDTHVHRLGRYLGLTQRNGAQWRTAVEITDRLRILEPVDPLRYDFALAHMGISGQCPTHRVESICRTCPIQRVCRLS
jgi:uncharacterized protein (TIGR02757 family)